VIREWRIAFSYYLGFREGREESADTVVANKAENTIFAQGCADRFWSNFKAMAGLLPSHQLRRRSYKLPRRPRSQKSRLYQRNSECPVGVLKRSSTDSGLPFDGPAQLVDRTAKRERGTPPSVGSHSTRANSRKRRESAKGGRKIRCQPSEGKMKPVRSNKTKPIKSILKLAQHQS
jgi:hypothetical protein